ncbi:MAG: hypothetical protein Q7V05_08250 [Methanoregula sp.]|nr:hypothetical protein [Methanoregula sp.]
MKSLKKCTAILLVLLIFIVGLVAASTTFISSGQQTLAKGDSFTITGTGATNGLIAVWIIGRDYFTVKTANPDQEGNYSFILNPEETGQFSSGQYAFVIQDPGANKMMDIKSRVADNGNITFQNGGTAIADIGPKQGIRTNAEPVVRILQTSITLWGVDDILTPYYFIVEEPSVHFDQKSSANPDGQLPNLNAGERITISGTTNMGVENPLHADIRNLETNTLITSKTIPVIAGSDTNRWSFDLDTAGFAPGEYLVTVGWMKSNTTGTGSTIFSVVAVSGPTLVPQNSGTLRTDAGGALPMPFIIGGAALLGIVALFVLSQRRKT